ncbi:hypothetical protein [Streptomyces phaeoluteigriseus]|uniref:hypothetical protein n=1 Tax=Streptomyces phaeoluteigriseus TaxID=114686 RepID=UPI00369CD52B
MIVGTSGVVNATWRDTDAGAVVSVTGGRVDAVAATGSSLLLAVATGDDSEIVELDTTTGKELHRAGVKGSPRPAARPRHRDLVPHRTARPGSHTGSASDSACVRCG